MAAPRARRLLRLLLLGCASLLAGLLLLEVSLRFLLFSESTLARRLGASFRQPQLYSSYTSGRDFWKLDGLFARDRPPDPRAPRADARYGWLHPSIDPQTLRHADEAKLGTRRPVLLYGDSYSACMLAAEDCWQGILERSDLSERYCLLNYGVPGYGLDQTYLLLRDTLALYAERKPLVIVGILADDDLDRCYLALRDMPKPWFSLGTAGLELHPPDPAATIEEYLTRDPLEVKSYLWRFLLTQSGAVKPWHVPAWIGEGEHAIVKQALTRELLTAIEHELSSHELERFYFLFHSRKSATLPRPWLWQEPLLYSEFRRRQLPFVSSKRPLIEGTRRTQTALTDYFILQGPGQGHYNPRGNELVFEALRAGLEGRFEPYEFLAGVKGASGKVLPQIEEAFGLTLGDGDGPADGADE